MTQAAPSPRAPLVVIDLQTVMFDGSAGGTIHDAGGMVERVRTLLSWARASGRKVAFIRHDGPEGDPLAPGAAGWPVWPALGQLADEPTFSKSVGDAFSNPEFGTWVREQHADEVLLLGAQSDYCVAATVKGALAGGLAVTVVSDTHSTVDAEGETAAGIIARKNAEFAAAGARLVDARTLVER